MRIGLAVLLAVLAWAGAHAETLELPRPGGTVWHLNASVTQPVAPGRGVLLFLHGYMASAAEFDTTLRPFVDRGWTVVTLDLPGHGGSDGPRFDIDDFADYGDAVALWLRWVKAQNWTGPTVLVAFSLGAAAALEALRRQDTSAVDKVVFCAPLLRTDWHAGLSLANHLVGPMSGWLPGPWKTGTHWFAALDRWVVRLAASPATLNLRLTVYSGDRDQVVDESANRRLLSRLVPGLTWVNLPGRNHWFLQSKGDVEFQRLLAAELN